VPRKSKDDRHFVTALARGLEVLACFGTDESTLSNQELAQRRELPKSTVSRLTMTLTKLGYLIHVAESGRYRLGTSCLALGSAMLTRLDVRKIARPMMQELAKFSNATVSLGVRDKLSMIYVENCRSAAALTLTLDVGSRIPVATSAIGRAWLVAVPDRERDAFMEPVREIDDVAWPGILHRAGPGGLPHARSYLLDRRLAEGREWDRARVLSRQRFADHGHQCRRTFV